MGERERKSMLTAAALLCGAALVRFVVADGGPPPTPLEGRPSIADSLLVAGDSVAKEKERRSRPLEPGERIDPNVAGEEDLDRLPGVGPATAARIVKAREGGGPFASVDDLLRVRGIGPATVERMRPLLRVNPGEARPGALGAGAGDRSAGRGGGPGAITAPAGGRGSRAAGSSVGGPHGATAASSPDDRGAASAGATARVVDVNRAGADELVALPGIGPVTARRIVESRETDGPFGRPEDLMRVQGIGPKTFARIAALVTVRQ